MHDHGALNDFRLLGRSGLRISPLTLGAMTFGMDWGWGSDEKQSRQVFDMYAERGGNTLDTANNYTQGTSGGLTSRRQASLSRPYSRALRSRMLRSRQFRGQTLSNTIARWLRIGMSSWQMLR